MDVKTPQRTLEKQLSETHCWVVHSGICCLLSRSRDNFFDLFKKMLPHVGAAAVLWASSQGLALLEGQAWIKNKNLRENKSQTQPTFLFFCFCGFMLLLFKLQTWESCKQLVQCFVFILIVSWYFFSVDELPDFVFPLDVLSSYQWLVSNLLAVDAAHWRSGLILHKDNQSLPALCSICEISCQDVHYQFQVKILF